MRVTLWVVQVLLAILFLWAGSIKLILPVEQLTGPVPMPAPFLRFIGMMELLGGLGLILPGVLAILPILTPLAASGLVIIMIGATVVTLVGGEVVMAAMPVVVGLLAAFVAYGRWRLLPHRGAAPPPAIRPARREA